MPENGSRELPHLEASNFQALSQFPGSHSQGVFAPDGERVAFLSEDEDGVAQVWLVALDSEAPVQLSTGPVAASRPRWSTSVESILFDRQGEGIWRIATTGGEPEQLVAGAGARRGPRGFQDRLAITQYSHPAVVFLTAPSPSGTPIRSQARPLQACSCVEV